MRRHLVVSIVVLLAACAGFQTYRLHGIDFPNKSGRLANGLRVVIQPDDTQPTVLTKIRYEVGAAHDPKDKKGLAHLVEHLAFRLGDEIVVTPVESKATGSASGNAAPAPVRERIVSYLVSDNAYTTLDETVYHKEVVPYHLNSVLEDLAAQMGDFSSRITPEVFAAEREVVRNERRSSYEGRPLNRVWLDLYDRLYPKDHPYQGEAVIGSHETLQRMTLADVSAFTAAHYHPANATLTIVGPVDPEATLALVSQHFGGKPKLAPSELLPPTWQATRRQEVVVVPNAKNTMVTVVWPIGPADSDEALALRSLDESSWFWYRLVRNRGWSYWASSWVDEGELESRFVVQTLLRDHDDVNQVRDKILEIAGLLDGAIDAADFRGSRRRFSYNHMLGAENRYDRADAMSRFFSKRGQPIAWAALFERYEAMELGTVRSLGSRLLAADRAFVLVHTPIDPAEGGDHAATSHASTTDSEVKKAGDLKQTHEERDTLPERYEFAQPFDAYQTWAVAGAEKQQTAVEVTLDNGLRCLIRQEGQLPIMGVTLLFAGGKLAESQELTGVGHLMLSSMGMTGRALWEQRSKIGVWADYDSDGEVVTLTERFPSFYADTALAQLAERAREAVFRQTDVSEVRDNWLRELAEGEEVIDTVASRAYWRLRGFEQLSPVATKRTVERIGRGDVQEYYEKVFYPENGVLSIVSDRPVEEVRAAVEQHFGGWGRKEQAPYDLVHSISNVDAAPKGHLALVAIDAAQSQILVTFDAPGWTDWRGGALTDGVALLIKKRAKRLREAYGSTYGVGVDRGSWAQLGTLRLSTKVEKAATTKGLETLLQAIEHVKSTKVGSSELEHVKRQLMYDMSSWAESCAGKAETIAKRAAKGRPATYAEDYVRHVAALSVADLQATIDTLLTQMPIVVVAGAEPDLSLIPALATQQPTRFRAEDLL